MLPYTRVGNDHFELCGKSKSNCTTRIKGKSNEEGRGAGGALQINTKPFCIVNSLQGLLFTSCLKIIIMLKSLFLSSMLFFSIIALAQNDVPAKDSFVISSIPTYDINGNQYRYEKKLDHYPTREDTLLMEKEFHTWLSPITDSVERENRRLDSIIANYPKQELKNYAPLKPREGKHLFALHWISWKNFGSVVIKKINTNKYSVKGAQKDSKGNFVTIDGFLRPINRGEMKLSGEIKSKVSGNNNGELCVKKGKFTFLCLPGRKYWRLQERENCGGEVVDYIDIFF